MASPQTPAPRPADLVGFLVEHLGRRGPRFVVVAGPVGAGKSSLIRALFPALAPPKLLLLYQQPMAPSEAGGVRPTLGGATTVLLVDPQAAGGEPKGPTPSAGPSLYTAPSMGRAPTEGQLDVPEALVRAFQRLESAGGGSAVLDSWDRDSEEYARAAAPAEAIAKFSLPASDLGALQSTLVSLRANLVLAVVPELAQGLQSLADAVVELRTAEHDGARVRIATLAKFRGAAIDPPDHLYTLDGARFRAFPDLPPGFSPTVPPPDPDPEPDAGTLWPGAATFARVFGRLPYGTLTALTLSRECPDALPMTIAGPLVATVLRGHGRAVWMPAPSVRPSRVVSLLEGLVPREWIGERLRILSPSGEDPTLGELANVVLPLRRETGPIGDARAAASSGVGPVFPDAHRFLRQAPEGAAALYVLSLEGLKASAIAAGVAVDAVTLPAVLAGYLRLPRFHGFGYGRANDPMAAALLPTVHTILHMQTLCGQTVVHGLRPRTPAHVIEWRRGGYTLTPAG